MRTPSTTAIRVGFAIVLLVVGATLAGSYAAADATVTDPAPASDGTPAVGSETDARDTPTGSTATPTDTPDESDGSDSIRLERRINRSNVTESAVSGGQLTVVATQGYYVDDEQAELVAFSEAGDVVYHQDQYRVYFDVDPVAGTDYTVEYVAAKHLGGDACTETSRCTRNVVRRVNLSTGAERTVYAKVTPRIYSARWHDVDRYNETHLVVADIVNDGVYLVDTRDNETEWRWNATADFSPESGGKENDWTHVNDVEVLDDGRIMASLRNHDQVIFLRPTADGSTPRMTMQESWTLGRDDAHDVLYEQHNPDYIPDERGGPAILVADSENGRVLEYQRTNGTWVRTWGWTDERLQWPRDADRLPNDNTLVVDSHGDRVVEVTPEGEVVWTVQIGMPYDVERLGTGDESAGGQSMQAIRADRRDARAGDGGESTSPSPDGESVIESPDLGPTERFWLGLKDLLPDLVVNGLLYVSPPWVRFTDLVFGIVFVANALAWGGFEFHRSRWSLRGAVGRVRGRLSGR